MSRSQCCSGYVDRGMVMERSRGNCSSDCCFYAARIGCGENCDVLVSCTAMMSMSPSNIAAMTIDVLFAPCVFHWTIGTRRCTSGWLLRLPVVLVVVLFEV